MELRRLTEFIAKAVSRAPDDEPLLQKLDGLQQRVRTAPQKQVDAQAFAQSAELTWERISGAINETQNRPLPWRPFVLINDGCWGTGGCSTSSSYRADPRMKRANQKWAIVTLRSAPNAPRNFALGNCGSSASAFLPGPRDRPLPLAGRALPACSAPEIATSGMTARDWRLNTVVPGNED
jgi:hypothetical protein